MLERVAQSICKQASKIINYSVIITNHEGVIIGSSTDERLGTLHEASLESIKYCRQLYHNKTAAKKLAGTRQGITMPIVIDNHVLGTVGITGTPDEVSKYGNLIKIFAEMLVRTEQIKGSAILKNKDRLELLREIITFDGTKEAAENLVSHGSILDYDMKLPRVAIYLDYRKLPESIAREKKATNSGGFDYHVIVKNKFCDPQDIRISVGDERYVVFTVVDKDSENYWQRLKRICRALEEQLKECGFALTAGIGSRAMNLSELKQSYDEARLAWGVALERSSGSTNLFVGEFSLEKLVYAIPQEVIRKFVTTHFAQLQKQKDYDELVKMVHVWCEANFNQTLAAQRLNIHKNTLTYRLQRFERLTGMDLRDFNCAAASYIATCTKSL